VPSTDFLAGLTHLPSSGSARLRKAQLEALFCLECALVHAFPPALIEGTREAMIEKLKNGLWAIIGIPVLLGLAMINDVVAAVMPRWFQCLWGLC
jgi:hypothetical protein